MLETIKVFIGLDEPYKIVYDVCKYSILKNNKKYNLDIIPINYNTVKDYNRVKDQYESTQFSFARFWTPFESDFKGVSIFLDSDFLFLDSIDSLIDLYDEEKAIMCCKHNYKPTNSKKMDNKVQTVYPRKNWSSLIIFNNSHPKNKILEPFMLNTSTGSYLHRFSWLDDEDIGNLPLQWNWLTDWYSETEDFKPKALHYTEGGPWLDNYKDCKYNKHWDSIKNEFKYKNLRNEYEWHNI